MNARDVLFINDGGIATRRWVFRALKGAFLMVVLGSVTLPARSQSPLPLKMSAHKSGASGSLSIAAGNTFYNAGTVIAPHRSHSDAVTRHVVVYPYPYASNVLDLRQKVLIQATTPGFSNYQWTVTTDAKTTYKFPGVMPEYGSPNIIK